MQTFDRLMQTFADGQTLFYISIINELSLPSFLQTVNRRLILLTAGGSSKRSPAGHSNDWSGKLITALIKNYMKKHENSRRRFLKNSLGALGAFTIVPRHVLGGKGFIPP